MLPRLLGGFHEIVFNTIFWFHNVFSCAPPTPFFLNCAAAAAARDLRSSAITCKCEQRQRAFTAVFLSGRRSIEAGTALQACILRIMSDGADAAVDLQAEQDAASPPPSPVVAEAVAEAADGVADDEADGAFRRRAPPALSREQLRSPLATPAAPATPAALATLSTPATPANPPAAFPNPSASVHDEADGSSDEEQPLSRRRPRRESAAAAAAAKAAAPAPSLSTPQELVDWCIAQAVSVATLPFEQAPHSIAAQVAAFSASFKQQVLRQRAALCCHPSSCTPHRVRPHILFQLASLYRNQHKLVAEISRVEGDGDAPALASAQHFPAACAADVSAAAARAYEIARCAAAAAEDEERKLKRLHSEYSVLCALCSQVDTGLVSSSVVQDGSALLQQVHPTLNRHSSTVGLHPPSHHHPSISRCVATA